VNTLGYILVSTACVSLVSLAGVLAQNLRAGTLARAASGAVAFAAGVMLGAAFLSLIPGALHGDHHQGFVLAGILLFFLLERAVHRHCRGRLCISPSGGGPAAEAVYGFSEGVIIAAAWLVGTGPGLMAALAVGVHELPHQLEGFTQRKAESPERAAGMTLLTALGSIGGALAGFALLAGNPTVAARVVAFAAGGLIYIAVADLLPDLHRERRLSQILVHTAWLLSGVFLSAGLIRLVSGS